MHQLVHGLVYAESPEDAYTTARDEVFETVVTEGAADHYALFNEDLDRSPIDRWSDVPAVARVDDEEGRRLVERGWESSVDEYRKRFDRIEELLSSQDREAFWKDGMVHSDYAHEFRSLGQRRGMSTFLYDQNGEGVRHREHLERIEDAVDDLDLERYQNLELYVVPADLQY